MGDAAIIPAPAIINTYLSLNQQTAIINTYLSLNQQIAYLAYPWMSIQSKTDLLDYLDEVRVKLELAGYLIFSPLHHTHRMPFAYSCMGFPEPDYVQQDIEILSCFRPYQVIILMSNLAIKDGHWFSTGCHREYLFAAEKRIPVYILEDFLRGNKVFFWKLLEKEAY